MSGTSELEHLLAESVVMAAEEPTKPTLDLDDLLAESMVSVKAEREAKAARERLKRGGLSAADQAADAERIRQWELANEWKVVANVAMFERYRCACGRQQTIFRQLMQRQQHRHLRDSMRYQRAETQKADLPNEIAVQKWEVPMCTHCSPAAGFDFNTQQVKEWVA